jgi:hypothetical protein
MKLLKTTLAVLALSVAGAANAGFVHTDWNVEGDAQATLHEETGIEWLKLNNTGGMSINQVSADNSYEGWRFPTDAEMSEMILGLVGDIDYIVSTNGSSSGESPEYYAAAQTWIDAFSVTKSNPTVTTSWGLHGTSFSGGRTFSNGDGLIYKSYSNYTPDHSHIAWGVFLVSDGGTTLSSQQDPSINANNAINNVPVALASLLPLFGLAFARRRR